MKEPDFLCRWDFCTSCIEYRKKNDLPMPKLKRHGMFATGIVPDKMKRKYDPMLQ